MVPYGESFASLPMSWATGNKFLGRAAYVYNLNRLATFGVKLQCENTMRLPMSVQCTTSV